MPIFGYIGVKSGRAEVVAAADGHKRHAGFARLFNGKLHGPVRSAFTHAVLSVQKRVGRAVGQDLESRVDIHPARAEFFDIVMQVFRPVGVRPIRVRLGKRLGAAARGRGWSRREYRTGARAFKNGKAFECCG